MCGIVGIFSFDGPPPYSEIWAELVNHLKHRGPDEGAWWAEGPFFLGHRRLSIIDLSSGGQPMGTAEGNLIVTFNGEIYNYIELRAELQHLGYIFQTHSDTEVLLHGYCAWGTDLPSKLVGMFAFAIADRHRRELFLARDRFGEKPLFTLQMPKYLAFASELRPLAAFPDLDRVLDIEALGGYLCLNYVPGTATLLKRIRRLAPASWALYHEDGRYQSETYWTVPDPNEWSSNQSMDEALDELQERLDQAVGLCLRSDVPVGIFLSGGMDSSLVAESAMRQGKLSQAYFIDFSEKSYSEYEAAKEVAERLGVPLEKTVLTPDVLKDFFSFVDHADDPMADSSAVNVWTISKCAKSRNKVVLGGDGGDEVFGGYLTYQASQLHHNIISRFPMSVRKLIVNAGRHLPTSEKKVALSYKLHRFQRAASLPTVQAHFTWNGTWMPEQAASLMRSGPEREIVRHALSELVNRLRLQKMGLLQLQKADIQEYLPNDILAKVDRMSMAHGLETRSPLLNHNLAEWALRRPDYQKVSLSETKVLLRALARRIYGNTIADRPKQGFSIPIHEWIRGPLKEIVRDLLSVQSIKKLEVFDFDYVGKVVDDHFSKRKSYGFELWGLCVLSAWHKIRIEHPPARPQESPLIRRQIALKQ